MIEIRKGDTVRHTVLAVSSEDTSEQLIRTNGWSSDVIEETIEVVERVDDPANDPVGTVREMPAEEDGDGDVYAAYPVVKAGEDTWVDVDGVYRVEEVPWGDEWMVGKPIIGAVPGSPADILGSVKRVDSVVELEAKVKVLDRAKRLAEFNERRWQDAFYDDRERVKSPFIQRHVEVDWRDPSTPTYAARADALEQAAEVYNYGAEPSRAVGAASPFIQRRKQTETDVRDRIAQIIQDMDQYLGFRAAREWSDYQWGAERVMDAMEADR